ncbi:MAG TPA: hypothetical protein VE130_15645 [Nitrososphaeraceae archaeon]|nr:hypothetical protein [Nitrososphaeraceae archaeon]
MLENKRYLCLSIEAATGFSHTGLPPAGLGKEGGWPIFDWF